MDRKPLYYKHVNNTFKFGSELQIFLDDKDTKLHQESLNKYLYFGYVKNSSLIKNVNQLDPGKYLELNYTRKYNYNSFSLGYSRKSSSLKL